MMVDDEVLLGGTKGFLKAYSTWVLVTSTCYNQLQFVKNPTKNDTIIIKPNDYL